MVALLTGLQTGYTKYCCFLCLWDSRATANHYVCRVVTSRSNGAWLSLARCDAVEQINYLLAPAKLEDTPFTGIEGALLWHLEPEEQLTVSERANFFSTTQARAQSIAEFVVVLRTAAQYCKFRELKAAADPMEELIKMHLVLGLQLPDMKVKLLEYMQSKPNAIVREMVCFLQNFEQSKKFVLGSVEDSSMMAEIHYEGVWSTISWTIPRRLCSFCGGNWHESLQSCLARKSGLQQLQSERPFCTQMSAMVNTSTFSTGSLEGVRQFWHQRGGLLVCQLQLHGQHYGNGQNSCSRYQNASGHGIRLNNHQF